MGVLPIGTFETLFPSSVQRILEELPESLDETYERILREIKKPNQIHAHRLLQCLVAALRPLQVKELAEVLAVDFDAEGIPKLNPDWRWQDEEEAVISACSSLVMIVNDKDDKDSQIVQFSHFSVKEFLTANRLAEPIRDVSYYHIRLEAAHTIIAQASLGILLRLDDRPDGYSLESFPMAEYAAESWFTHAGFGNTLSRIKDGMECLFDADKPHFAMWPRVCSESLKRHTGMHLDERGDPLFYAAMFGFCDLAQHLIARHPEHMNVMDQGGMYRYILQRIEEIPRFCHYFLHRARMSISGTTFAGLRYFTHRFKDISKLGSVYSIMELISMHNSLTTTKVQLHYTTWSHVDISSILECYLNVGQRLIPCILLATLYCTWRQEHLLTVPRSRSHYWSTARTSMRATQRARLHCTPRYYRLISKSHNCYWRTVRMSMRETSLALLLAKRRHYCIRHHICH